MNIVIKLTLNIAIGWFTFGNSACTQVRLPRCYQQKIKLYCFFKVTIQIKVAYVGIFLRLSFSECLSQTWSFFFFLFFCSNTGMLVFKDIIRYYELCLRRSNTFLQHSGMKRVRKAVFLFCFVLFLFCNKMHPGLSQDTGENWNQQLGPYLEVSTGNS